jgi:hypothetical protein
MKRQDLHVLYFIICPDLLTVSFSPLKVLDAPELQDDFYLNLVDWSSQNVLSVGLGSCVYLWSACTSQVTRLCDLSGDGNSVTSVAWNERVSVRLIIFTQDSEKYLLNLNLIIAFFFFWLTFKGHVMCKCSTNCVGRLPCSALNTCRFWSPISDLCLVLQLCYRVVRNVGAVDIVAI